MKRLLPLAALVLLAVAGCAVTDQQGAVGTPSARPQDPARIALPPAYRAFFDELQDEGDWTLIEPYGYVFRPRVNFVAWRPYQDGWWEASDYYGWVWNSYEPFGWITYHYGSWFYDEFQGWVWQPGPQWGPAWVAWVVTEDYVGWAPLPPTAYNGFDRVPDGVFTYAPVTQFVARNIGEKATFVSHLPTTVRSYREVLNFGHGNGAVFNRGPDLASLQRRLGTINERIDDSELQRVKLAGPAPRLTEADLATRSARAVTAGRTELRRMIERGVTPPSSGASHLAPQPPPPPRVKPATKPAAPDTTRHRPSRAPADSTARPDSTRKRAPRSPLEEKRPRSPGMEPDTTRNG
jgi:hypothetical protein